MSTELSPEDRTAIERIRVAVVRGYIPDIAEALARHFLAAGLERAAVICDNSVPSQGSHFAKMIRAAKGQPCSETLTDAEAAEVKAVLCGIFSSLDSDNYGLEPTQTELDVYRAGKAAGRAEAAVPREPTVTMMIAGRKRCMADMLGPHMGPDTEAIWRAMYDAALAAK